MANLTKKRIARRLLGVQGRYDDLLNQIVTLRAQVKGLESSAVMANNHALHLIATHTDLLSTLSSRVGDIEKRLQGEPDPDAKAAADELAEAERIEWEREEQEMTREETGG